MKNEETIDLSEMSEEAQKAFYASFRVHAGHMDDEQAERIHAREHAAASSAARMAEARRKSRLDYIASGRAGNGV